MKITKRQLRRIIREMHPRAAADDAYVAELEKKEELATQIRNASKDILGRKDFYDLEGKSIEELEDILYDLANSQEQQEIDDIARDEIEDEMGRDYELSRAEMSPSRQGMRRRPAGSKSQRRMETVERIRKIVKESLNEIDRDAMMDMEARERAGDLEAQDLSKPIPIDDLRFMDEEGYGAMMFPGTGFSYSVRENEFEAKKAELKKRYGDDVMISIPDPRYPKVKKLHSKKAASADSAERRNFMRNQKMMRKALGREPSLGS